MGQESSEDFNYYSQYLRLINNCDVNDQLLSQTQLGQRMQQLPLQQINPSDLIQLNQALNLEQLIRTKDGLARDYRGLAELMDFGSLEIETRFKRSYNPTKTLIDSFINKNLILINFQQQQQQHQQRPDNNKNKQTPVLFTLNDLLKMIERLERFDVIDDFLPTLIRIASNNDGAHGYLMRPTKTTTNCLDISDKNLNRRLTVDDRGGLETIYDAFVCFAPEDTHYAEDLIRLLEQLDKRVATADDLLPGHFEHDALVQLIDVRCRKVIIILTPNFVRSKECEFQSKFATEMAIKANVGPKIIPVLYEACEDLSLPYMIRVISKIDMTSRQARQWQLRKLISSLELYENSAVSTSPLSYSRSSGRHSSSHRAILSPTTTTTTTGDSLQPIVDLASSSISSNDCNLTTSLITNSIHAAHHQNHQQANRQALPLPSLKLTPPLSSSFSSSSSSSLSPSINWFKNVRRKLLGSQQQHQQEPNREAAATRNSPSPSTSSQAMLLTSSESTSQLSLANGASSHGQVNGYD